ncbi:MAG: hypothetical protein KA184_10040 [Candidatus Hydrogenedentes bacterium]|nr:hypothetical protein [Candidatus Hydrogenedentota bacterium]
MNKTVFLGVAVCATLVFAGCQTCPSEDEAKALPKGYCGYGPKVRMTYSLFQGVTLARLFAADTPASAVFAGWKKNAEALDEGSGFEPQVLALLRQHTLELHGASAGLGNDVTFRSLFADGAASLPQPVRAKLNALEKMGVDLPFLHPLAVDRTTFDNIVQTLLDMGFGGMDLYALYHTPADPAVFSDAHIDAIDAALDAKILRFGDIDFLCVTEDGASAKAANMCCSKTTRKCLSCSGMSCSMCGLYCCLGSSWCSQ